MTELIISLTSLDGSRTVLECLNACLRVEVKEAIWIEPPDETPSVTPRERMLYRVAVALG